MNKFLIIFIMSLSIAVVSRTDAVTNTPVQTPFATQAPTSTYTSSPLQTDSTCHPTNCWEGITRDVTTLDEAQAILKDKYDKEYAPIPRGWRGYINWETNSDQYQGGQLQINDQGIVDSISIWYSEGQITVAEFIERMGEPSFVYVVVSFSPEGKCAASYLVYSEGISAYIYNSLEFQPNQLISSFDLLPFDAIRGVTDVWILEWQGYADYCELAGNENVHIP